MSKSYKQAIYDTIWHADSSQLNRLQKAVLQFVQITAKVMQDIAGGMLTLRAMSLVYTTLLSFVPLIAVSFSVLKGFGVHNQVEPFLLNFLEPLGDKAADITENIVGFVENMKIGVLGALGLGLLVFTVLSLIHKIESALNYTWRMRTARNMAQRFSNYLSVVMVGPVLVFSAIGISASLHNHSVVSVLEQIPYMGDMLDLIGKLVPTILIILAFAMVYMLVPNTRVNVKSALYGAVIGGLLWRLAGATFASFASGSTSYTAIYSGFAIILLFMIWLYVGWIILLVGASYSYYHQNPEMLRWKGVNPHMSATLREKLALELMHLIGSAHYQGAAANAMPALLMDRISTPNNLINRMLNNLQDGGLIVLSEGDTPHYLPARSIDQISLQSILQVAREADDEALTEALDHPPINQLQQQVNQAIASSMQQQTLMDLIVTVDDKGNIKESA